MALVVGVVGGNGVYTTQGRCTFRVDDNNNDLQFSLAAAAVSSESELAIPFEFWVKEFAATVVGYTKLVFSVFVWYFIVILARIHQCIYQLEIGGHVCGAIVPRIFGRDVHRLGRVSDSSAGGNGRIGLILRLL